MKSVCSLCGNRTLVLVLFPLLLWMFLQFVVRLTLDQPSQPTSQMARKFYVFFRRGKIQMWLDDNLVAEEERDEEEIGRGVLLAVFRSDGHRTGSRTFDTCGTSPTMGAYLESIPGERVIVFAIISSSCNLGFSARNHLTQLGSSSISTLPLGSTWILAVHKRSNPAAIAVLAEAASTPRPETGITTAPLTLQFDFPTLAPSDLLVCQSSSSSSTSHEKRSRFCGLTDGYPEVCRCENPHDIIFHPAPLQLETTSEFMVDRRINVPVAVIAGNRPYYLNTMLRALLMTSGVDPALITVFTDGLHAEPGHIADLYGLRSIHHISSGRTSTAMISQHYRSSLSASFTLHPRAGFVIVLEEDVLVAEDFFTYIAQTLPVLAEDPSLYCVSAWNDLGRENETGEPGRLYRVEGMPGLGMAISRALFEKELLPNWPSPLKKWDWDMWMRSPAIRKGRECIIPDVSRTYHFGSTGLNMNPFFHKAYFQSHPFYTGPVVTLHDVHLLTKNRYEELLKGILQTAVPVDHSRHPCSPDFIPTATTDHVVSVFIQMKDIDDSATWLALCRCLKIWDLDVRGDHGALWRLRVNENSVIVVGVPASPYSYALPSGVSPIDLRVTAEV
ncbi:Protein O-linked-mannose beta-1,2-N-acetylglucosaminyltransferase 1 [Hypsibius exemplaris]|uniref:Alpha-1,3-mannosyl-glycoprotein 2-beta-N-acetylglucosaminyltransferase n=1 Tax=Hypsibius exemplaris TaxID=2072580 RepID=A0A1W0WDP0_HYPEX|nr:Protein O-linked-mannose beta-1,2-N-acetylglucosaminyltransferase 1 [Hypsibius exemplaris]